MRYRLTWGATAVLALAAACSGGATPASATPSPTPPTTRAVTSTGPVTPSEALPTSAAAGQPVPAGNGCPRNGGKIPAGANRVVTADLDLDGAADTLWFGDVAAGRTIGVQTATGATFSATFQSAAPAQARAIGQKLAPAGPSIILVDTGRAVLLFDVVDCAIVPVKNAQGAQYTFDQGFTGYGTGVDCVRGSAGYTLAGLLAAPEKSGITFTVTRTAITLSDFGRRARNGRTRTLATHAGAGSAVVRYARTVSCGTPSRVVYEAG